MKPPHLEILPRQHNDSDALSNIQDLLVTIVPPPMESKIERPQINLAIVIDRSSSMSIENRLVFAKAAARQILETLRPTDRIAIVTFDGAAQTIVPSTLVANKAEILPIIQTIKCGQWTNLHEGWLAAGREINQHGHPDTMNRIILLSDGWISKGLSNRDLIVSQAQDLAQSGISTTTVGVGHSYNERLLGDLAIGGDGNYYYVNTPQQLPNLFKKEIDTLIATLARKVTLSIEPQDNVEILDILNDLNIDHRGRYLLPNCVADHPFNIVLKLAIPKTCSTVNLCFFRLCWQDVQSGHPHEIRVPFQLNQLETPAKNTELVHTHVILMQVARFKRKANQSVAIADFPAAYSYLDQAMELLLEVPYNPLIHEALAEVETLNLQLRSNQIEVFRKQSHQQIHKMTMGFDQTIGPWSSEDLDS